MTKLFEELDEGMKQAIDVAEGKMPGRITTRSEEIIKKEKIIGFTGDTCVERKGKRTSSVDSLTGILSGKNISKGLSKHDLRWMTDQELQQLIEKAVSELYAR